MKTLGKLKINSEKMLGNEELVNLKGGYAGGDYVCCCWVGTNNCSACVQRWSGSYCVAGAELRSC